MKYLFIFFVFSLLYSCKEQINKSKNIESAIVAGGQSDKELQESLKQFQEEERRRIENEMKSSTTLTFDKLRHDFGNVKPDSENTCKFKVTNTGKNPLIIENVSASCGCTTPHKPEKPIPPGSSDYIEVGFHPKPGQLNEIIKTVTVTANTVPKISEISIRAFVK